MEANFGTVLSPGLLREHLRVTGVPQGAGGHIGPLPDLRRAIDDLENLVDTVWVDFAHLGMEDGSFERPYNTLVEAAGMTPVGGHVRMKAGSTSEAPTLDTRLTLDTYDGIAVVGETEVLLRARPARTE